MQSIIRLVVVFYLAYLKSAETTRFGSFFKYIIYNNQFLTIKNKKHFSSHVINLTLKNENLKNYVDILEKYHSVRSFII